MITRVLFIDSDAEALARIKRAVEQAGNYEVQVFVTGQAALEYATERPPDLVVISLNVRDIAPNALAQTLRTIRPDLPLLLRAPSDTDETIIKALNPRGVLRGGYTARALIPMVEDALKSTLPVEPATPSAPEAHKAKPSIRPPTSPDDDLSSFGEVLSSIQTGPSPAKEDTFKTLVNSMRGPVEQSSLLKRREKLANWASAPQPPDDVEDLDEDETPVPSPEEDVLFQKLAAEEPPMPTLEDSGTVKDLIAVTDFKEQQEAQVVDIPDDMIQDVSELPLDSAEQELLEALAAASSAPPTPAQPVEAENGPELIPMPENLQARISNGNMEELPSPEPKILSPVPEPTRRPPRQPSPRSVSGGTTPANLALQLTQHTLESAAQATILLRGHEVVASAGALPERDIAELASIIDTETVLADGSTKIKFVSLPEARLNFMVVAAPTLADMVLVTVFPENMHLRTIRQQTKHMLESLLESASAAPQPPEQPPEMPEDSVSMAVFPETRAPDPSEEVLTIGAEPDDDNYGLTGTLEAEEAEPVSAAAEGHEVDSREAVESRPIVDPATLTKYACAWILRQPEAELDDGLIRALFAWLEQIIVDNHWLSDQIDVQPDYISLVVSVPPGETPSEVVQALMTETAERILAVRPALAVEGGLWADAYYIIAPGRPLSSEEISRFISYQREM